jgi:hypothetical protein
MGTYKIAGKSSYSNIFKLSSKISENYGFVCQENGWVKQHKMLFLFNILDCISTFTFLFVKYSFWIFLPDHTLLPVHLQCTA